MSRFTILSEREIDQTHFDRASEILDTFAKRDDADWDDLASMIAEALQITENNCLGNSPSTPLKAIEEDDSSPDVEVTIHPN